ncbi:fumarate reductase subunit D [Lipingzhangella halophila]|uniref:Fumarate reductase subunit D n=1 Tax=Lipingzhangella halophila TaxID=1783352 RepID=A0A7W7RD18_9ACTN|nr:hypothetical protein [Lipingzhangella halophila]MBB4929734.1 fumarate reductase subunit D [Lipingzhangella halophila]
MPGLLCGILFVLGLAPDPFGAQPMVYVLGVLFGLILALVLAGCTALFLWCGTRAVHHLFAWVAPLCCSGLLVASATTG